MVYLFEKNEEGVNFAESANTPIPWGKVVNIAYLLILMIGGMEKSCEQREDIQFGQKPGRLSSTIFHKTTGTIISARRKKLRPMGMGHQQIIHRKQKPKSCLRMRYNHLHVQQFKTKIQWRTSPA